MKNTPLKNGCNPMALIRLEGVHLVQALNDLEAYNLEVGLLINFGARNLQFKRLHNKKYKNV